jgi:hypothetical protein
VHFYLVAWHIVLTIATAGVVKDLELHLFSTWDFIYSNNPKSINWAWEDHNCEQLQRPGDIECNRLTLTPDKILQDGQFDLLLPGWVSQLREQELSKLGVAPKEAEAQPAQTAPNPQTHLYSPQSSYPQQVHAFPPAYWQPAPLQDYQPGYTTPSNDPPSQGASSKKIILRLEYIPKRISNRGSGHLKNILETKLQVTLPKVELDTGTGVAWIQFANNSDARHKVGSKGPVVALEAWKFPDPPDQPGLNKTEPELLADWEPDSAPDFGPS